MTKRLMNEGRYVIKSLPEVGYVPELVTLLDNQRSK